MPTDLSVHDGTVPLCLVNLNPELLLSLRHPRHTSLCSPNPYSTVSAPAHLTPTSDSSLSVSVSKPKPRAKASGGKKTASISNSLFATPVSSTGTATGKKSGAGSRARGGRGRRASSLRIGTGGASVGVAAGAEAEEEEKLYRVCKTTYDDDEKTMIACDECVFFRFLSLLLFFLFLFFCPRGGRSCGTCELALTPAYTADDGRPCSISSRLLVPSCPFLIIQTAD